MNYKNTYKLMRNFYNLGINEVRIIDYLMDKEVEITTYCRLTRSLGLEVSKHSPNIRKAMLHLQELGIVCIVNEYDEEESKKHKSNPMRACFLIDGWMESLLEKEF